MREHAPRAERANGTGRSRRVTTTAGALRAMREQLKIVRPDLPSAVSARS